MFNLISSIAFPLKMQHLSCLLTLSRFVLHFLKKMTGERKLENAQQSNDEDRKEESWHAVLYQVLKCNIIRGLVMFVVYCGLAWLVRMVEDTDQGQREEGENKYHL
jgi:hypothetical protein